MLEPNIKPGCKCVIVAPGASHTGREATVIRRSGRQGEFVELDFGDGTTGTWMIGELELVIESITEDDGEIQ